MPPAQGGGDRLPPQNRDAERCVLGSMLRDNGVIGDVLEIAQMGFIGQTYTLQEAVAKAYDRIDIRQQRGEMSMSGIATGFVDLDDKTAGLQNSELIILAARPSVGKTAMALNIARHVAVDEKAPVFFVSLEQARIDLAERLLVCQARVDSHKPRKGTMGGEETQRILEA